MEAKTNSILKQKGEEAYLSITPLFVKLQGKDSTCLDLVAFYKTKKGESGGVYPETYGKGSLGNLNAFPFMQLNIEGSKENREKILSITKLHDIEVIYFCVLNFKNVVAGKATAFNTCEVFIEILDGEIKSFVVPLTANQSGSVAIIAKIDKSSFMGSKLINESLIVSLKQLLDSFPGTRNFIKTIVEHRSQKIQPSSPTKEQKVTKTKEQQATKNKEQQATEGINVKSGYCFAHQETLPIENNLSLLKQWFKQRNIQFNLDEEKIDISGFFDEIAVELGDNYSLLADLHGKIKWCYRKGHSRLNFDLSKYSQQEGGKVKNFCQNLLKAAFLTKYYAEKDTKKIHLALQQLPKVENFFKGDWLEWFVFMKVASFLWEKKLNFAYCRGGHLIFQNGDRHEIDLFFLVNGKIPLWIECKSGEFRSSLAKYITLRERLKIDKANTLLFVMGLSNEESSSLTAMFDVSIINECNFLTYVARCLN